jgi:phage repressor protein C with HTH and peptisase S24 domain
MRRIALALAAVLIAALALAACGGDSAPTKADYQEQFQPVNEQIKTLGQSVGDAIVNAKGKADAELSAEFTDLATQTTAAAKAVGELDPPDDAAIQKDQDALEAALNQGARDLTSIASAADAGNAKAAAAAVAKLAADSDDIRKPRERIEKALAADSSAAQS